MGRAPSMLPFIVIATLVTAHCVLGAPSGMKGISIPLQLRELPSKSGAIMQGDRWRQMTEALKSALLSKRRSVPLGSMADETVWATLVKIGTSGVDFLVQVDTGSSMTWVFSTECKDPICENKHKYDPSKSSPEKLDPDPMRLSYPGEQSSLYGTLYADKVAIAGLSAQSQVFISVEEVYNLRDYGIEGSLGLGVKTSPKLPTLIENLFNQGKISRNMFSMYLSSGSGSELYIGGANPKKYTGEITYVAVPEGKTEWMVKGSARLNGVEEYSGNMLIDSGSTLILGPHEDVERWWSRVPGSAPCPVEVCEYPGLFMYPCNYPPDVSFVFNGRAFSVLPRELNYYQLPSASDSDPMCVGAIHASNLDNEWILGSRFMKNVYTVFDVAASRIGFATLLIERPPTPETSSLQEHPSATGATEAIRSGSPQPHMENVSESDRFRCFGSGASCHILAKRSHEA